MGEDAAGRTDDLVERAQAGDASSYDRLFERVADRLLLYIRIRLGEALRGKLDPFDVLQETYLEAHRSFASFRPQGEGAFLRWLYRLADHRLYNLADHFQAKKRTAQGGEVRTPEIIARIRVEQTGPSTACARQEEHQRLLGAMHGLDPDEREALLMRYFQEATLEDVAGHMQRSVSAVRRLLAKAELRLGTALREAQGGF